MNKQLRIIVYGNTLVLAGIHFSLAANPAFEVISFQGSDSGEQELLALQPDVVIFDTNSVQPQFHYDPIRSSLLLIGINSETNQVMVWSGRQFSALSIQELFPLIQTGGQGDSSE